MILRQLFRALLAVLIAAFLFLFLLLPIYTVVAEGLNPSLIKEVFSNFIYLEGLANSFRIAAVTTFMVFLIALPMAFLYDAYEFPGKSLAHLAAMVPMILPPFVGALGFQQILGHYGVINTLLVSCGFARVDFLGGNGRFWSICFIEALHLYPILYLNLVSSLGNIDPSLREAARNLGAGVWRRFFRISLPLLKSGILAGGSIVLIWSFTELGTPLMFGYSRVTPVQILNGLT
ncbi:MAG TPA: ABC transporter permease, partial [Lentisphaeria bacterium]|nr:ABC transporter permease [Lentisphaeria bacterium]